MGGLASGALSLSNDSSCFSDSPGSIVGLPFFQKIVKGAMQLEKNSEQIVDRHFTFPKMNAIGFVFSIL